MSTRAVLHLILCLWGICMPSASSKSRDGCGDDVACSGLVLTARPIEASLLQGRKLDVNSMK